MTQCEKVLRHLRTFGSITPMEAIQEYGIMRLGGPVLGSEEQRYPGRE